MEENVLTFHRSEEITINCRTHSNNHVNLSLYVQTIIDLGPILDILYPRHSIREDEKFAFIKDSVTFKIDSDFEIFDKDAIKNFKKL